MSSAASRLISLRNNATLQNLIQRHFLRPSASAATEVHNTVSAPQLPGELYAENAKPCLSTLPVQKASYNASEIMNCSTEHFPFGMFGLFGFNQNGTIKIHTRRSSRGDSDLEDPDDEDTDESDDGDEGVYDSRNDMDDGDSSEDYYDNSDDEKGAPRRRWKFE